MKATSWSDGKAEQGVVAGADAAVVGTDEELRLSTEVLGQVDFNLPDRRRCVVTLLLGLQLCPLVTDHDCHGTRHRHAQLNDIPTHSQCILMWSRGHAWPWSWSWDRKMRSLVFHYWPKSFTYFFLTLFKMQCIMYY